MTDLVEAGRGSVGGRSYECRWLPVCADEGRSIVVSGDVGDDSVMEELGCCCGAWCRTALMVCGEEMKKRAGVAAGGRSAPMREALLRLC